MSWKHRLGVRRSSPLSISTAGITTSDSLRDFVRYPFGGTRVISGAICAAPWLAGMLLGVCGRGNAKERFLAATLGSIAQRELEDAGRQYASTRLPAQIRPEMLVRVQEHRRKGHMLVLVSASLAIYLKWWAKEMGFDAVLATELEFRDGRFSGRLASLNCWGPEKVRRLRQLLRGDQPLVCYAYGDSRGDKEMLAVADHPWRRGEGMLHNIDAW